MELIAQEKFVNTRSSRRDTFSTQNCTQISSFGGLGTSGIQFEHARDSRHQAPRHFDHTRTLKKNHFMAPPGHINDELDSSKKTNEKLGERKMDLKAKATGDVDV